MNQQRVIQAARTRTRIDERNTVRVSTRLVALFRSISVFKLDYFALHFPA